MGAKLGMQRVEDWDCSDMTSGLQGELIQLDMNLYHALSTTNLTARSADFATIHDLATSTATTIMALDEKRCLREAMQDPGIREIIESLNQRSLELLSMPDLSAEARHGKARGQALRVSGGCVAFDRDLVRASVQW